MSKDKSHKKDKSKKHDLFSLMLEQSEVFRNMVTHFQSAWTPKMFSNKHDENTHTAPVAEKVIAKKPPRAAKSAKKPVAKVVPAAKKVKPVAASIAKKPAAAARKNSAKKTPAAKSVKPAVTKKIAVKTARRPAKKSSPKK
ncbi:hypothetical protein B0E48_14975 [Rhodanobacter sp. C03]|nr:hypothetical protein B0E48_14975 [Rhodanobacter sp. C03]